MLKLAGLVQLYELAGIVQLDELAGFLQLDELRGEHTRQASEERLLNSLRKYQVADLQKSLLGFQYVVSFVELVEHCHLV